MASSKPFHQFLRRLTIIALLPDEINVTFGIRERRTGYFNPVVQASVLTI